MRRTTVLALAAAASLAACGGGGSRALTVSAASSLTAALGAYAGQFGQTVHLQFAGSDDLAAQIREGARPDVYAAADTALPARLHRAGLVGRPVPFARNRLVIAVPASSSSIDGLADLARPGTAIALGTRTVPAGAYARQVLARLPDPERRAILANVVTEEPEVTGIVAKLTQGVVDAGLVYATDVRAAGGALRAIPLPARVRPDVTYAAAAVTGAEHPAAARRFVRGLLRGPGARDLAAAGFLPPPR